MSPRVREFTRELSRREGPKHAWPLGGTQGELGGGAGAGNQGASQGGGACLLWGKALFEKALV